MLVFVDRKGSYLIAEGDELIIGNESEQIFSNFYPSQANQENIPIPFYQKGLEFTYNSQAECSYSYCSSVMRNMKQDITQYTTVYDLEALTIRIYYFQDFGEYREIDLKEELRQGEHKLSIPKLFTDNAAGKKYYDIYNDVENPTNFLKKEFRDNYSHLSGFNLQRAKESFAQFLNIIGYEWLYDKKEPNGAISIFQYGTELIPDNANLFDSLGEAYLTNGNYRKALESYEQSLLLNPSNDNAVKAISTIKERVRDD